MKLAAVGSNCIDFYNNIDGGKAYPGGGPVNMAVYTLRLAAMPPISALWAMMSTARSCWMPSQPRAWTPPICM